MIFLICHLKKAFYALTCQLDGCVFKTKCKKETFKKEPQARIMSLSNTKL